MTDKPILIYPNSGERYDADKKEWVVCSHLANLKDASMICSSCSGILTAICFLYAIDDIPKGIFPLEVSSGTGF